MKTKLACVAIALTALAPVAVAQDATPVRAEFKFESNLSTEDNYEAIETRANTVCRNAARRSDTFAPTDTAETVANCRSELVDAAVAALGVTELSDMHEARS
ncbi:hypothetical protein [Ponticaulis sp.]|uniref:hypothetical protein n=1 Tax=Ponticaulis sp. TaxID=2020902 RepID=UPI000B725AEE|nr:hypothetical protein [Ponticaulis sp.]RPG16942.1 MAG: hypothetical protein CBC85_008500 [Hyphomonadaceae bacterium TMED125]HBH89545.1 hypothetical protein [Hyphomonadaceae bacterium]MAJ07371.1 hypothetical protein [Ponticaulis sp.]MAJ09158.1 hypothetical protein [Ponticaulis sp.]MDF1678961.1 hypothetical protein [Ponticaulis sp.]|tara:strand:- start:17293 stop:17598 length:306 start_codon:yes stop_codon:yes gene_type:complete